MLNTNVGDMPLDIFCDYISDILGQEWNWQYLIPIDSDNVPMRYMRFYYGKGYMLISSPTHGDGYKISETYGDGNNSYGSLHGDAKGFGDGCLENINN
jgi:hypothetical protein